MGRTLFFIVRQAVLISIAALAYFGVRGLTESDPWAAYRHAGQIYRFERRFHLDVELGFQDLVGRSEFAVDVFNWIYIWGHWPVIAITLVALAVVDRRGFFELRNAIFISGAIGLVIFATYAVTPPRLFSSEFFDTVTERSNSYRVLQPPNLVNRYAAIPSLHFGWNLLVGLSWSKTMPWRFGPWLGVVMPVAMGLAVVATANHWVLDVIVGGIVGLAGLAIERGRARWWPAVVERFDLGGPPEPSSEETIREPQRS